MSDTESRAVSPAPAPAKTEAKSESNAEPVTQVTLRVRLVEAEPREMYFKSKLAMPLKRLMDTWAKKMGRERAGVRFMFDGNPLQDSDTVESLSMTDLDTIEVFAEQTGGR